MKVDYKIALKNGEIPLLFNTWMYREYSKRKGVELEDLFEGIRTGAGFKVKDIPDILLVAHESYCRYNSKDFTQTDLDACDWLDEMGGFNAPQIVELYKLFVCKLINVDPAQFEILWNKVTQPEVKTEKKKVTKEVPGESSTRSQRKPVASRGK